MVSRARTLPLSGSMWRMSLWSPSHVPCQSSPSTHVHSRDEAVRLDRAQDRARLGVDLVDLPVAVLSDPERALGPRQARVVTLAGRRKVATTAPVAGSTF